MPVSIIIPHYGDDALLDACLESIKATTTGSVDVVVHNSNASGYGFAEACNEGAENAPGDVLVFLNNDTICQTGWLRPLVGWCREGWLAGPKLVYPDGSIQCAGVRVGTDERGIVTAWNRQGPFPGGEVDALTGACLAIPAFLFDALDGFDEGFVNGYEDVDLCLRARALGARCRYEPASVVTHLESQSGPARWTHVRENVALLDERWAGRWQRQTS